MITFPSKTKVVSRKENRAVFEIEGLYPGYGVTIGNSLRRVLLSSLVGSSITKVKIDGVNHEFSTLPGVYEDVVNIILNLKQLRFKLYGDEPQKAYLKAKGNKEVKGEDFECPSQLEVMNKDHHIATLTAKTASLNLEVLVEKGVGYQPVEMRKKEKTEVGAIYVDAIFTPVRKVSYRVENMRVGERTDYDRLLIDVETDGSISPEEAIAKACEILINHFSIIQSPFSEISDNTGEDSENDFLNSSVSELGLSNKITDILLNNKIKTVKSLISKSKRDLTSLDGLGPKAIEDIEKSLKKHNLKLSQ